MQHEALNLAGLAHYVRNTMTITRGERTFRMACGVEKVIP